MSELIGRVIDQYRLEAMLGDGGMGTVYRAYDLNLERPVALKIMHPHYARRPEFRARLRQEAKTLASLDHPSIVRVLDYGEEADLAYVAMEYISGGNLRAHLRRLQKRQQYLPLEQALQIGSQIASALSYAHERGLIHRDVKPGNIILKRLNEPDEPDEQPFRAILTDFGLVKLLQGDSLTQSGTTLGTPAYMAPEQCEGADLDGRSDLYSLGIVLYELIANRLPFQFNSLAEAIAAHMRGEMPPPPSEIRPGIPGIVDTIIMRALAKDPVDRYVGAEAMATDLRSAMYSLSDAPTRVLSDVAAEAVATEAVDAVPEGYRLTIQTPGYEPTEMELTQLVLSLGRDSDNDVVLPADGVSRYHARFQVMPSGWAVVDLGGVNGTRLNGERIPVNEPVRLRSGDQLQIGPYRLTLEGPGEAPEEADRPVAEQPTPPPRITTPPPEGPLALFLARDRIAVSPGEEAEFRLEIANRSDTDDRVTVLVEGLPDGWAETPDEFVPVPAGGSAPVTVLIRPPRRTEVPAGRKRFRLRARSQQHPGAEPTVTASLMLGAVETFEAVLNPQRITLPGTLQVSLRNTGNAPNTFSIVGHDPERNVRFRGEQGRVRLEPQQRAVIELEVEPRQQKWFASTEAYPFAIEVSTRSGSRQMLSAEADMGSLVPTWLSYAALMLVVFICVFSILFVAFGDQIWGSRGAQVTGLAGTETAIAAVDLQTIVAATATIDAATRLALTPTTTADSDGDGLSDEQEATLGTSPEDPDSDGDGLFDGPEALQHGCDPTQRDSDGDFLNDWDEINLYGTNCSDPDTDGDGLSDGMEVTQGTDPLTPAEATATITTTPSPTAEVTPSITPTPSATSPPTVTPTPSETPPPTETSTPEPTVTVTSTPTITPTPPPAMACASSPPVVDGLLNDEVWQPGPAATVSEGGDSLGVYLGKDAGTFYYALAIGDSSVDAEDVAGIYVDANRNQGDPDEQDRLYEVARDGSVNVFRGIGTNVDGQQWEPHESEGVQAAAAAAEAGQWTAELSVPLSGSSAPGLANPFGLMVEILVEPGFLFGGETIVWPEEAQAEDASTWSAVDNPSCP